MSHIFISYSRTDADFAQRIVDALAQMGLDTWIDLKSIPKGEDWEQEIYKGIEEADVFLFLISQESVQSEMCNKEIAHALSNAKRILPIYVADAGLDTVKKVFFSEKNKVEIFRRNLIFCKYRKLPDNTVFMIDDFAKAIEQIQLTIKSDYKWLRYHTKLQLEALEWERTGDNSRLLRGKNLQEAERILASIVSSKDPRPTDLQRLFVLKSRNAEDRLRRIITRVIIGVTGFICLLGVIAAIGGGTAYFESKARATAEANRIAEANARATAQADAIAEAARREEAEANTEEQTKIALAQKLASQAQTIYDSRDSLQVTAVLLAVQSMKLYPSSEASQLIGTNLLANPVRTMKNDEYVSSVAYSPDGKYIGSGGCDIKVDDTCAQGSARVWDAVTGKEISRITINTDVHYVAFSPDSKYILTASNNWSAQAWGVGIWEATTGEVVSYRSHDNPVGSVAISPNGKFVVSESSSPNNDSAADYPWIGHIYIWDVYSGKDILSFTTENFVQSLAISSDSKFVVSGGGDGTARVWEISTGNEISRVTHDGVVKSVAFSPDGKYVVSGGADRTARVWEIVTGAEIARMNHNHSVDIDSVAFSPDGKYVVSGSFDSTARVWEAATGNEISRMTHDSRITSVLFSPDGKYVMSNSNDETVRVWETMTGKEIARISHEHHIKSMTFSPDGKYVVTGADDKTIRLWRMSAGKDLVSKNYSSQVTFITFSHDGKYLISAAEDQYIRVWDLSTESEIAFMKHNAAVVSVGLSPDNKYIVSRSSDNTVLVWETTTARLVTRITDPEALPLVTFSRDGKYLISMSGADTALILETSDGREIWRLTHGRGKVFASFSRDSKYIVSHSQDNIVYVWEAATGKEVIQLIHNRPVTFAFFSPDGTYVISDICEELSITDDNCDKGTIYVWEFATGEIIAQMTHEGFVDTVFSPDGNYMLLWSDKTILVWEVLTQKMIAEIPHKSTIVDVSFSPDSKYIVSGGWDKTAHVWEVTTGEEISQMVHAGVIESVSFSPDGEYVVSMACDQTEGISESCIQYAARIWNTQTGTELYRLLHEELVRAVVFSPDGNYLISGSHDQTARVWEFATGKEITRMTHDNNVTSVNFSPDGKYAISLSVDTSNRDSGIFHYQTRIWLWQPDELIKNACSYLPRNLSFDEWNQYIGDVLPYQAVCPNLPVEMSVP